MSFLFLSSSSLSNEAPDDLNEFEVTDNLVALGLPLNEFLSYVGGISNSTRKLS